MCIVFTITVPNGSLQHACSFLLIFCTGFYDDVNVAVLFVIILTSCIHISFHFSIIENQAFEVSEISLFKVKYKPLFFSVLSYHGDSL